MVDADRSGDQFRQYDNLLQRQYQFQCMTGNLVASVWPHGDAGRCLHPGISEHNRQLQSGALWQLLHH